jgi:hypothetical protein
MRCWGDVIVSTARPFDSYFAVQVVREQPGQTAALPRAGKAVGSVAGVGARGGG